MLGMKRLIPIICILAGCAHRPAVPPPERETIQGIVIEKRANFKSYEAWNSPSDPYFVLDMGDVTEKYTDGKKEWQENRKRNVTLRPSEKVTTGDLAKLKGKRVTLFGYYTEGQPYKPSNNCEQYPIEPDIKAKADGTPEITGWRPANRGTGFVVTIIVKEEKSNTEPVHAGDGSTRAR